MHIYNKCIFTTYIFIGMAEPPQQLREYASKGNASKTAYCSKDSSYSQNSNQAVEYGATTSTSTTSSTTTSSRSGTGPETELAGQDKRAEDSEEAKTGYFGLGLSGDRFRIDERDENKQEQQQQQQHHQQQTKWGCELQQSATIDNMGNHSDTLNSSNTLGNVGTVSNNSKSVDSNGGDAVNSSSKNLNKFKRLSVETGVPSVGHDQLSALLERYGVTSD